MGKLSFLAANEALVRGGIFFAALALLASAEALLPRRRRSFSRTVRWPVNLGMGLANTLILRFAVPLLAVGAALWAEEARIGVFHWAAVPFWAAAILSFLALDLLVYGQHVAMHHVPFLWRLHYIHHTDRDFDVTTALRFHPLEVLLSMALKIGAVLALGAPVAAVIIFEIVLNAAAMFNHANLALPERADRFLRLVLVTPDMHRVHHSAVRRETDSNYGFSVSWWDRLFATYHPAPEAGHAAMTLGLPGYQDGRPNSAAFAFLSPFVPITAR